MSELHKFIFEGLPVRGLLVRLTDSWQDILKRREDNLETGPYPEAVRHLLGEMTAAAEKVRSNSPWSRCNPICVCALPPKP